MLEAYYRYYYRDGKYGTFPGLQKSLHPTGGSCGQSGQTPGDNTYAGS